MHRPGLCTAQGVRSMVRRHPSRRRRRNQPLRSHLAAPRRGTVYCRARQGCDGYENAVDSIKLTRRLKSIHLHVPPTVVLTDAEDAGAVNARRTARSRRSSHDFRISAIRKLAPTPPRAPRNFSHRPAERHPRLSSDDLTGANANACGDRTPRGSNDNITPYREPEPRSPGSHAPQTCVAGLRIRWRPQSGGR